MKILVTGGAGYIGSSLVPLLLAGRHEVTVFDLLNRKSNILLPNFRKPGFSIIQGDIRDDDAVGEAVQETDAIVHLAAVSGYEDCKKNPSEAKEINVGGTRKLVKAAQGRFLLLASTSSCYGTVEPGVVCTEETPVNPISLYGATKADAEISVLDYPESLVFRFATGYGISPMMRLNLMVNSFVDQLIRTGELSVYEKEARRTFFHVQDMARSIVYALENRDKFPQRVYNIGDDKQNMTKEEVCRVILHYLPDGRITWDAGGEDPDKRNYQVSYALLGKTGFVPETGFEQGVEALVRALSFLKGEG